jgi:hypothetical protein
VTSEEHSRFVPSGSASSLRYFHQSIGNRAVGQLLTHATQLQRTPKPVIQRATIGKKPIKPYGKSGTLLWEVTREALLNNGLSPHGAKKVFIEIVKGDFDFDNEEHFIKRFVLSALEEAERVTDEKKLPKDKRKKGWTRELKLSRTPWPKEHKAAAQQGEDIRHVVRNATMRNALLAEYQHWMSQDKSGGMAFKEFTKLAGSVGLQVDTGMHAWDLLQEVYKTVYLNAGNLFAGPGGVNRVIGLTADDIEQTGLTLMKSDEKFTSPEKIEEIFDYVARLIAEKTDQTEATIEIAKNKDKIEEEGKETFLGGLDEFFDNISNYLIDVEDAFTDRVEEGTPVLASEVGQVLVEVGTNFGFDIPLEPLPQEHMVTLINVEKFLSQYKGGDSSNLAETLQAFVKLKNILNEK